MQRFWIISALLGFLWACGESSSEGEAPPVEEIDRSDACPTGKCDSANQGGDFEHLWAVDMKKVREHYGKSTSYFFGLSSSEAGLPPMFPGGEGVIWDQMALRNPNGSLHIDHSQDPESKEQVQLILEDGSRVDPPGYLNIISLLRDTEPENQTHLRAHMRNGDIIVYFHPEFSSVTQMMERRASHVAMHYDEPSPKNGQETVHHIDNPNGYGPRYNHRPSRQMPFHVYRFQPRSTRLFGGVPLEIKESVEGVDFSQSQLEAVLALANEADFRTLDVDVALDRRAAENIINAREQLGKLEALQELGKVPYVGPAALRRMRDYAAPSQEGFYIDAKQAESYGRHAISWAYMNNDLSPFADFFTLNLTRREQLPDFATAAILGEQLPRLYCSGLAYANLNLALNHPLNDLGLGELAESFEAGEWGFSDWDIKLKADNLRDKEGLIPIDQLVFRPYTATDIVNSWMELYLGQMPIPVRQQIIQMPQFQETLVSGFSKLEWGDPNAPEKMQSAQFNPASLENVQRWAKAYGRSVEETEAFLEDDPVLFERFRELDIPLSGLSPMDVLQAVERAMVPDRFVPPRIWMDEADKADSNLIYVGTVLNCELLSAADGSALDPCAGGGGLVKEFREGAAETSTYPHYRVENKGQRTHRRFDATVGPKSAGLGTQIIASLSAASAKEMILLLHPPSTWGEHESAGMSMSEYDNYCTERNPSQTCAPKAGILLTVPEFADSGALDAVDLKVDLFSGGGCRILNAELMECLMFRQDAEGTWSSELEELSRESQGLWGLTLVDQGESEAGPVLERCEACEAGGAQFNGWTLIVRDDEQP